MVKLSVNVDHVATLREARGGVEPDPVTAALLCEIIGAHGITVHLRSDRRHIKERDLKLLRATIKTELNLEMATTEEMIKIALEVKPDQCTLVPERPGELTTEGGLDIINQKEHLRDVIKRLHEAGIKVSIFVDPQEEQIKAAKEVGADRIELHTGIYARAKTAEEISKELEKLRRCAELAHELGLEVNAGHDLNFRNLPPVAKIPHLREVSIGHSIVARAVFIGLKSAVKEILDILEKAE